MTNPTVSGRAFPTVVLATGLVALGACDDPTVVDPHIDADGFAIVEGEAEVYRHLRDGEDAPVLQLTTGIHDVAFVLLDHEGEPLMEEGEEGEHADHVLEIAIADASVLTWTPEEHTDAHETIEFHGELNALTAGSTTMTVCVPHGSHCDLRVEVPVTVID